LVSSDRRLRSDAARNRAALLAAADVEFGERGANASLSATAARAGVSIGTLYKHFPTRQALIGALLADRHDTLFAWAAALTGDDVVTWVRGLVAHAATYRGLAEMIAEGGAERTADDDEAEGSLRLADDCRRMSEITHDLVADARRRGGLHAEATADDLLALAGAAAWVREHHGAEQADRLVEAALRGWGASLGAVPGP